MADLYCPRCGEPWDMDELHDVPGVPFGMAYKRFQEIGCRVFGSRCNEREVPPEEIGMIRAAYSMLEDDPDAAAAVLSDEFSTYSSPPPSEEDAAPLKQIDGFTLPPEEISSEQIPVDTSCIPTSEIRWHVKRINLREPDETVAREILKVTEEWFSGDEERRRYCRQQALLYAIKIFREHQEQLASLRL